MTHTTCPDCNGWGQIDVDSILANCCWCDGTGVIYNEEEEDE